MATGETQIERDVEIERIDAEIDEISKRVLSELESASSKDLSDVHYATMMLELSEIHYAKRLLVEIGSAKKHCSESTGAESAIEKRAVIKALLYSTWLERLYFIIRVFIMGRIASIVTFSTVLYFTTIDFYGMVILDTFLFVFTLVVTRLFDKQIVQATKYIVARLAGHRTIRDFIMSHF